MPGAQGEHRYKITMLPTGCKFAVIRMDPVSMVSHLDLDSIAIAEAAAMEPKKYLVYLDAPQDLPMPTSEWCRYWVQPVATVLRPAVPEQGITPDMVMPIHPNTRYAKGRQPVQSTPQFPFPDCYFWMKSLMSLRVKIKRGTDVYDNDKGATVSTAQHVKLRSAWNDDVLRMSSLRRAAALDSGSAAQGPPRAARPPAAIPHHAARHTTPSPTPSIPPTPSLPPTPLIPPTLREYLDDRSSDDDEDEDSIFDLSSRSSGQSDSPTSDDDGAVPTLPPLPPLLEKVIDMDLFGWAHDPKVPFIPLVDLWLELEDHLSADNIPSPTELWKEQETIGAIIEAAMKRRVAATLSSQGRPSSRDPQPPRRPSPSPVSTQQSALPWTDARAVSSGTRQGPVGKREAWIRAVQEGRKPPEYFSHVTQAEASFLHRRRKPEEEAKRDHNASAAPGASFASLFRSVAPLGNRIASWSLSTSRTPSPPPSTVSYMSRRSATASGNPKVPAKHMKRG